MKTTVIIAIAVGVFVSTFLLGMELLTDHALVWLDWQMPGINAAYLFWGAVGGSASAGIAIAWLVNAVVYGVGAFIALGTLKLLSLALPK